MARFTAARFTAALATLALCAVPAAGPALAQTPAQASAQVDPGPPKAGARGAAGRTVTGTGQTKPPGAAAGAAPATALPKPATEAEMIKAQKEAEARSKAWDTRMRRTMGSICHGC